MRPGEQQFLYAQQQQQQQQQQQIALHQAALQRSSAGFSLVQLQQQLSVNHAAFLSPHYAQLVALNGLQAWGGMDPMGGGGGGAISGMQRGLLPIQQNGLLQQQQQWAQLRPESRAWGSGVFPASQQGLIQPNLVQQHVQQQIAYLQDFKSGSVGLNEVPLPQVHGGDGLRGNQQWAHPHDGQGQYGASPISQDSRRSQDGMWQSGFSRGGSLGNGHPHGNGNKKPYDENSRGSGNWSRGGAGRGGDGGGHPNNPRFKGGKNEDRRVEESVRSKSVTKESQEEISRWIEERKRNYPTIANIEHKVDETKARKLRGELVDEDARKRKERLKEILAKQAELGVPVAEVPSYYMSDRYGSLKGKGAKGRSSGSGPSGNHRNGKRSHDGEHASNGVPEEDDKERPVKVPRILDGPNDSAEPGIRACKEEAETTKETQGIVELKNTLETEGVVRDDVATDKKDRKVSGKTSDKLCFFYKRGRCKKGNRCEFLHERRPKKEGDVSTRPVAKRAPTLLAKLLESDIRKEKSHLLQSFRFFVNSMFLLEFPEKPPKFFEWKEGNDRNSDAEVGRPKTEAQEIEMEDGSGSDEDVQTIHEEEDSGEISMWSAEPHEVQVDIDAEAHYVEDDVDSDQDMELFHEEENGSEVVTRSDEEIDS